MRTDGLELDPSTQMLHRPGTTHLAMIKEAQRVWLATQPGPSDVVLDMGANAGGYAVWAARRGARVVAYEAAPDTVEVTRANCEGLRNVEVRHAAVVASCDPGAEVSFYLSPRHETRGMANASIVPWRGRCEIRVPAADFLTVVREVQPTILKIDVEGAELTYPLLHPEVVACVQMLAVEVHVREEAQRLGIPDAAGGHDFGRALVDQIERRYTLVGGDPRMARRPLDFGTQWGVNGVWRRRD